jgi:hypothetical protein
MQLIEMVIVQEVVSQCRYRELRPPEENPPKLPITRLYHGSGYFLAYGR